MSLKEFLERCTTSAPVSVWLYTGASIKGNAEVLLEGLNDQLLKRDINMIDVVDNTITLTLIIDDLGD